MIRNRRRFHIFSGLALALLIPMSAHAEDQPVPRSRNLLALAGPCSPETFARAAKGLVVLCWERSAVQEAMTGKLLAAPTAMADRGAQEQVSPREVGELVRGEGQADVTVACVAQVPAIVAAGGLVTFDRNARPHCTVSQLAPEALRAVFIEIRF